MVDLGGFVRRLLKYDPDIVEVVQFGSSVYASEYAGDVDLLVVTRRMKKYSGYLDVLSLEGSPINIDVLVFDVSKIPKRGLLRSILGSFRLLYGEGRYLLEYAKYLGDPTFEEARASLKAASDYFELSKRTEDPLVRDRHLRVAFDTLFHAARSASMVYLSTDISRLIGRKLTEPYKTIFNEFINTLHIKYYNGPRENIEEELINGLEKLKNTSPNWSWKLKPSGNNSTLNWMLGRDCFRPLNFPVMEPTSSPGLGHVTLDSS